MGDIEGERSGDVAAVDGLFERDLTQRRGGEVVVGGHRFTRYDPEQPALGPRDVHGHRSQIATRGDGDGVAHLPRLVADGDLDQHLSADRAASDEGVAVGDALEDACLGGVAGLDVGGGEARHQHGMAIAACDHCDVNAPREHGLVPGERLPGCQLTGALGGTLEHRACRTVLNAYIGWRVDSAA